MRINANAQVNIRLTLLCLCGMDYDDGAGGRLKCTSMALSLGSILNTFR